MTLLYYMFNSVPSEISMPLSSTNIHATIPKGYTLKSRKHCLLLLHYILHLSQSRSHEELQAAPLSLKTTMEALQEVSVDAGSELEAISSKEEQKRCHWRLFLIDCCWKNVLLFSLDWLDWWFVQSPAKYCLKSAGALFYFLAASVPGESG